MPSTGNILDVAQNFSAASSGERSPLFQPMRVNPDSEQIATTQGRRLWQVPDAVNESGRVALNTLDVANQGRGIAPSTESITVGIGGEATAIASPLYQPLLIERLTDSVIRAEEHAAEIEQYRAEEEAAAEEGALIEASGYQRPEYERNGR